MNYEGVHTDWRQLMEQAKERAVACGNRVLVSFVERIEQVSPPAFFSIGQNEFAGRRFYWSEPDTSLTLVGLGSVLQLEASDPATRFSAIEKQWQHLAASFEVNEQVPAHTGPLLFGGFSFDPKKSHATEWRDFPHTRFTVPQYMLTQHAGGAWLTTNYWVSPDDETSAPADRLNLETLDLLHARNHLLSQAYIIKEDTVSTEWMDAVKQATQAIRAGKLEKTVLARHLRVATEQRFNMAAIIERLLQEQDANAYIFAIEFGSGCFIGATPERLIKRDGETFTTLCLAGSIGGGSSVEENDRLGQHLIHDAKNLHEHALTVNMIKGVMEELCETVQVPNHPMLRKLRDIQHLATPISGLAKPDMSLLHAVEMLHPTPALGGLPREAAIETIRQLEKIDRGWYAAPIGWMNRNGEGEFVVAIRSGIVQEREAVLFAGCGIVGDSDPISELQESALKFKPMLIALQADVEIPSACGEV